MAVRDAPCVEIECGHRHDVGAVQREQAMCRTRELDRRAIGPLIAHQFRNRQLFDRIGERFVESACQRLSLGQAPQVNVVSFAIGGDVDAIRSIGGIQGSGCARRAIFFLNASVIPEASRAALAGINLAITSASGATGRTYVTDTASRRGVAYDVATLSGSRKPRSRSPDSMPAANASPSRFSAFGGSSSVKSSTTRVSDI